MSHPNQSPSLLDVEPLFSIVNELIEEGETNRGVSKCLRSQGYEASEAAIRRFRKRHRLGPSLSRAKLTNKGSRRPGLQRDGDNVVVTSPATPHNPMDDPDAMLVERGLNPEEWLIEGATINEWDGPSEEGLRTYHQAKLHLKRKHPELQILPARSDGWKAPPIKPHLLQKKGSRLIVVTGDDQCPFHDENLHYLFLGWLEENCPEEGVALGDKVDFPDISRHRLDPENTAKVNECIQSAYDVWRARRVASPDTRWQFMPGNHDERIRNILLDKPSVQPLYGVKRADTPEEEGPPVLTLPHLLRLDELNIEYVDPQGPYDLAQINLSDKLAVRHGWIARQGSGATALATLEHLGYSVIVGHTHRQSLIYKTTHDIGGEIKTLTAAEAGCMCRVDQQPRGGRKWPNFTPLPDWQQGFSTVQMFNDGQFRIDHATYVNKTLLWRDQQFR